jgi:hypothetical protein
MDRAATRGWAVVACAAIAAIVATAVLAGPRLVAQPEAVVSGAAVGHDDHDIPTAAPIPAPAPSVRPAAPAGGAGARPAAARVVPVFHLDIPSVGIHAPVITVGVTSAGAMDAPEGPPRSSIWDQGFWLGSTATPGTPGTTTLAGHLDDTLGRPRAFWTLRQVQPGAEVDVTRLADGVVARYRITEVHVYSLQEGNSAAVLNRVFGINQSDGVSRISLMTCTGRFIHGEYNQRFIAYGERIG